MKYRMQIVPPNDLHNIVCRIFCCVKKKHGVEASCFDMCKLVLWYHAPKRTNSQLLLAAEKRSPLESSLGSDQVFNFQCYLEIYGWSVLTQGLIHYSATRKKWKLLICSVPVNSAPKWPKSNVFGKITMTWRQHWRQRTVVSKYLNSLTLKMPCCRWKSCNNPISTRNHAQLAFSSDTHPNLVTETWST